MGDLDWIEAMVQHPPSCLSELEQVAFAAGNLAFGLSSGGAGWRVLAADFTARRREVSPATAPTPRPPAAARAGSSWSSDRRLWLEMFHALS